MRANKVSYSFNLSIELADELKEYSKKIKKPESDLIEEVISAFLKKKVAATCCYLQKIK